MGPSGRFASPCLTVFWAVAHVLRMAMQPVTVPIPIDRDQYNAVAALPVAELKADIHQRGGTTDGYVMPCIRCHGRLLSPPDPTPGAWRRASWCGGTSRWLFRGR
jgi:hypothetical protein